MKVTRPMITDAVTDAASPYPAIVKPTERASMDVAMPCTRSVEKAILLTWPYMASAPSGMSAVKKHFSADIDQQNERHPRYGGLKKTEDADDGMDKEPAGQGH